MDIDKLEAGRELDALIAEHVMGIEVEWFQYHDKQPRLIKKGHGDNEWTAAMVEASVSAYSTDIGMAWEVWEKLPRIHSMGNHNMSISWHLIDVRSIHFDVNEYIARGVLDCGEWEYSISADTAPLAICRAALKAVTK